MGHMLLPSATEELDDVFSQVGKVYPTLRPLTALDAHEIRGCCVGQLNSPPIADIHSESILAIFFRC